jgi:hypothetical protein
MTTQQEQAVGTAGTISSWVLCLIGYITIQDVAWTLACFVSAGTIFLSWDKYMTKAKRHYREFNEWRRTPKKRKR